MTPSQTAVEIVVSWQEECLYVGCSEAAAISHLEDKIKEALTKQEQRIGRLRGALEEFMDNRMHDTRVTELAREALTAVDKMLEECRE